MTGDRFVLELPPAAAYLGTARAFSSQIARHTGCDDDVVEDVELAVSEACAGSVSQTGSDGQVVVRSTLGSGVVAFEVEGTGSLGSDEPTDAPARFDLIRTLFPDASLVAHADGRTTVRFSLPAGG